ncbi:hypothetical protein F2P81_018950 [Scophthalmus maximus]|uniref:Uncharacterized protein n=1 Tax=Scophthalmus maximus TaxID=52904 RepID=A0A6A4SBN0_SCOMX|nr:hypothetical protein F2P81_018950 [Scophthalmus maximus]
MPTCIVLVAPELSDYRKQDQVPAEEEEAEEREDCEEEWADMVLILFSRQPEEDEEEEQRLFSCHEDLIPGQRRAFVHSCATDQICVRVGGGGGGAPVQQHNSPRLMKCGCDNTCKHLQRFILVLLDGNIELSYILQPHVLRGQEIFPPLVLCVDAAAQMQDLGMSTLWKSDGTKGHRTAEARFKAIPKFLQTKWSEDSRVKDAK